MEYLHEEAIVIYRSKGGKDKKTCNAQEGTAAMGTHVPLRSEQIVRHYGGFRVAATPSLLLDMKTEPFGAVCALSGDKLEDIEPAVPMGIIEIVGFDPVDFV